MHQNGGENRKSTAILVRGYSEKAQCTGELLLHAINRGGIGRREQTATKQTFRIYEVSIYKGAIVFSEQQSTADIKESNIYLRVTELTTHGRKINIPPTHNMHQLRQTHRPRNRSHKIPLPQLRRNPNQTRRKMPQIRKTLQMRKTWAA